MCFRSSVWNAAAQIHPKIGPRGAQVRGLISPGPDGVFGTADDLLIASGETVLEVQDRVLGAGVNSSFLFNTVPGYAVFGVRGGFRIREDQEILLDFETSATATTGASLGALTRRGAISAFATPPGSNLPG